MRGISKLVVATALLGLLPGTAAAHHGESGGVIGCGGTAPLTTWCSSGWHTSDARHDEHVVSGEAFTGLIESRLEFAPSGSVGRNCEFRAGIEASCAQWGAMPPEGTPMYHTCSATLIGTAAAGLGSFGCILR